MARPRSTTWTFTPACCAVAAAVTPDSPAPTTSRSDELTRGSSDRSRRGTRRCVRFPRSHQLLRRLDQAQSDNAGNLDCPHGSRAPVRDLSSHSGEARPTHGDTPRARRHRTRQRDLQPMPDRRAPPTRVNSAGVRELPNPDRHLQPTLLPLRDPPATALAADPPAGFLLMPWSFR